MAFQNRTSYGLSTQLGEDWRDRAACRDVDPETFFTDEMKSPLAAVDVARAKETCRRCPVLDACSAWVRLNPQEFGIFGGLTAAERRGSKLKDPARRWCQRCHMPFEWDPQHPTARICPGCSLAREANVERVKAVA